MTLMKPQMSFFFMNDINDNSIAVSQTAYLLAKLFIQGLFMQWNYDWN